MVYRKLQWTGRLVAESYLWEHSSFITLTYDDDWRTGCLNYSDVQLFMKRLRKAHGGPLRFFCAGEYGERNGREHWHILIFGLYPPFREVGEWDLWPHGSTHIGDVTRQSAAYTAGYKLKNFGETRDSAFIRMSRRPGIGHDFYVRAGRFAAENNLSPVLSFIRHKDKKLPTDAYGKQTFYRAYELSGGTGTPEPKKSPLALEIEHFSHIMGGDLESLTQAHHHDHQQRMINNGKTIPQQLTQEQIWQRLQGKSPDWYKPETS